LEQQVMGPAHDRLLEQAQKQAQMLAQGLAQGLTTTAAATAATALATHAAFQAMAPPQTGAQPATQTEALGNDSDAASALLGPQHRELCPYRTQPVPATGVNIHTESRERHTDDRSAPS
jgi:hypothetical protein